MVKLIGDGYHTNALPSERLYLLEIDADQWKNWGHARLSTPVDGRGALSLFEGSPQEHLALAKHLTAERKVEEFVAGKGTVTRWPDRLPGLFMNVVTSRVKSFRGKECKRPAAAVLVNTARMDRAA